MGLGHCTLKLLLLALSQAGNIAVNLNLDELHVLLVVLLVLIFLGNTAFMSTSKHLLLRSFLLNFEEAEVVSRWTEDKRFVFPQIIVFVLLFLLLSLENGAALLFHLVDGLSVLLLPLFVNLFTFIKHVLLEVIVLLTLDDLELLLSLDELVLLDLFQLLFLLVGFPVLVIQLEVDGLVL